MSAWRRTALAMLAEHRSLIERSGSPMALWIELQGLFGECVKREDRDGMRRILAYATWCVNQPIGHGGDDAVNAVVCGFYEHLGANRTLWPHFPEWFFPHEFERIQGAFRYFLSDAQFEELRAVFREGERQRDPLTRRSRGRKP